MARVLVVDDLDTGGTRLMFECPGCGETHAPLVNATGRWLMWNGDVEHPSINPSVRVVDGSHVCHFFLFGGTLWFSKDSTHKLAGQAVDLPQAKAL